MFSTPTGPLVGGFAFAAESWRWTQWITLMIGLAAYLLGIGLPETYHRKILRRKSKLHAVGQKLPEADSGRTLRQMTQITFLTPLKMLATEPIVILISWSLGFNFAVRFQFFVTVPVALHRIHNFNIQQIGLAFITAIVGALLAALTAIILDRITAPRAAKKSQSRMSMNIEYRLYPAMIGSVLMAASLFWIGWTNKTTISWASPVLGSLTYVWGSALMLVKSPFLHSSIHHSLPYELVRAHETRANRPRLSVQIAYISYLFDAYPARGTLSALTAVACTRVSFAGWLPLVAIQSQ